MVDVRLKRTHPEAVKVWTNGKHYIEVVDSTTGRIVVLPSGSTLAEILEAVTRGR